MSKKIIFTITALLLFLNGCSESSDYKLMQTKDAESKRPTKVTSQSIEYRILPQDRLNIILYKNPEQSATVSMQDLGQNMNSEGVLVNAAGDITMPLIGKIKVAGLSQTQAADRITTAYKMYLRTPSVYLEVMNKRIYVLGEVKNPGVVKLDKEKMTLFEALAFAGDLEDSAVRDNIIIVSNDPERGMVMRSVDLTNFDTMNYAALMLRPNDIVYVQPDGWKEFRVASTNLTAPFETISKIASPFVTIKYLKD
ncbi:polysaccharide biosynthesis/export family protein [Sulfurovum mangrovi]|uniref:polysaccharide biosynthesis/export family protein n=1 Tax=Sulfurovum mangrovi TaxID=2893889 RepID=UPI001E2F1DA5|nr:polysaccharide biosynthesis/export family protein [Sulfurovum mangrovi]UFH58552.1 polysaccharide export protein [Sulfurovum mangrovi]